MNLNSDLGEGAGHDVEVLEHVDSANVCCGVHAGSVSESIATVDACRARGVQVGAHPGYDDRAHFGRVAVDMSAEELSALIRYQLGALSAIAEPAYVKPHGALYHRCQTDEIAAEVLARIAAEFELAVLCQPDTVLAEACLKAGIRAYREGFADRGYRPDGRLVPRTEPGAMLSPDDAAAQAVRLARSGGIDSICIHGDSPTASMTARRVREKLREAGIQTAPLS